MSRASDADSIIAPVPRVSIQVYCETPAMAATLEAAFADRRMQKAQTTVALGGAAAALQTYREHPTPNVVVLESGRGPDELLARLDTLAEVCDAGASTVAHNLAWAIARKLATATVIVDLDIAFGTAGLDFNQDPPQGVAE